MDGNVDLLTTLVRYLKTSHQRNRRAASRTVEVVHLKVQILREGFRCHIGVDVDAHNLKAPKSATVPEIKAGTRVILPPPIYKSRPPLAQGRRTRCRPQPVAEFGNPGLGWKSSPDSIRNVSGRPSSRWGGIKPGDDEAEGVASRTSQFGYCSATSTAHAPQPNPHSRTLLSWGMAGKINLFSNILLNTSCIIRSRSSSSYSMPN